MSHTIALNMIVKDEAHVIARCLESVRAHIDRWVIVDTGSSDVTRERVRELLRDIPGELHRRPWRDFGHNRSEAFDLVRGQADYVLFLDADEELLLPEGWTWPELDAGGYRLRQLSGTSGHSFQLLKLVRGDLPWRWEGVLHEHLACDEPHSVENLPGPTVHGHFDGARNRDPSAKYRRDAEVLERALEHEPNNARYVFYLAQSYRDAGDLDGAIRNYRRRAALGGWAEEVWYSLYQVAVLIERTGVAAAAIVAHLSAYSARPTRAEPLVQLARIHRQRDEHAAALLFARRAASMTKPDDILFLDESAYSWRSLDEQSIAEYYAGDPAAGLAAAERALAHPDLPEGQRARIEENARFCRDAVSAARA